jgi:hypothetical protein
MEETKPVVKAKWKPRISQKLGGRSVRALFYDLLPAAVFDEHTLSAIDPLCLTFASSADLRMTGFFVGPVLAALKLSAAWTIIVIGFMPSLRRGQVDLRGI